jgi:hypothetical protein
MLIPYYHYELFFFKRSRSVRRFIYMLECRVPQRNKEKKCSSVTSKLKRTHTLFFKSFQSSLFLSLLAAGKAAACQLPYTPPYILPVHVLLCHKLTYQLRLQARNSATENAFSASIGLHTSENTLAVRGPCRVVTVQLLHV